MIKKFGAKNGSTYTKTNHYLRKQYSISNISISIILLFTLIKD